MTNFALVFTNYFIAFGALFLAYIKALMIAGFLGFILKGLAEFLM